MGGQQTNEVKQMKIKSLENAEETLVLVIKELDNMGKSNSMVRYVVDRVLNHGSSYHSAMEKWNEGNKNGAWK